MNKQTFRNVIFYGLFFIPFVSFLVSSSFFFPFITAKAFTWRVIVELVFALYLVLVVVAPEYRPKKSPLLYAVGAFIFIIGLADLFGVAPMQSFWSDFERMEGFITLLHLAAYFLVISSVFNESDWRRYWNTTLVASSIMVIYALFQLAGTVAIHQGGVRVDGTLGNATYLAVYMLFHVFIALMMASRAKGGLRWAYGLLIIGQLFILYHTATRGAILGFLGGLLVIAFLNLRNREDALIRKLSLGTVAALASVVLGFFALRQTPFVQESPVLSRFAEISAQELQSGGRSFVWPMALQGIKERPLLGWGQENFVFVFQKHYSPEMYRLEPWFDRAHNIFLDWGVAGGLLGLISYLALYVALLYLIWKREGFTHFERSLLSGLIAAYFFHNIFVFDNLISYILFFSLIGDVHSRSALPWSENVSLPKWFPQASVALAVALVVPFYLWNVRPLTANVNLIEAMKAYQTQDFTSAIANFKKSYGPTLGRGEIVEQIAVHTAGILSSNLPMEERNDFYSFAKGAVLKEADENQREARRQLVAGSFLTSTGYPKDALVYLERAKALMPGKQQVYYDIGSAYFADNQAYEGLKAFQMAYDMAPNNLEAKVVYLLGAIYSGQSNIEREMKKQLTEREFYFDDRILSAYYSQKRTADVIAMLKKRIELDPAHAAEYEKLISEVRK